MEFKKYVEIICPYCKHKNENKCDIRKTIDGVVRCLEYELDKTSLIEAYEKREDLKYDLSRSARGRQAIQKQKVVEAKKT